MARTMSIGKRRRYFCIGNRRRGRPHSRTAGNRPRYLWLVFDSFRADVPIRFEFTFPEHLAVRSIQIRVKIWFSGHDDEFGSEDRR